MAATGRYEVRGPDGKGGEISLGFSESRSGVWQLKRAAWYNGIKRGYCVVIDHRPDEPPVIRRGVERGTKYKRFGVGR